MFDKRRHRKIVEISRDLILFLQSQGNVTYDNVIVKKLIGELNKIKPPKKTNWQKITLISLFAMAGVQIVLAILGLLVK